jgi:hypothetical protein
MKCIATATMKQNNIPSIFSRQILTTQVALLMISAYAPPATFQS